MSRPIDSALGVVQGIADQARSSREVPTVEELIATVRGFERITFDVPEGNDSDGFLFQYGEVNWFAEPAFTVGFVRQMEIVDADGEHEGYSQVQLEYRYRADPDLRSLRGLNSWWFRDGGTSFDEWIRSVEQDPIWGIIRGKFPVEFDISQELA
ncbi:hypothetical protein [Micromonospora endophytica]|uniref:hypothetical protein n=1 Tax=Micromonospora endophytica TaxID=515350 RepID=UPI0011B6AEFF|nr:hypothetical protein [Micromonospora endophytica]BCJ59919.1 hypothetical protein Jiend_33410 [Micromonospora endophytica]